MGEKARKERKKEMGIYMYGGEKMVRGKERKKKLFLFICWVQSVNCRGSI